mmetsp:Transcript_52688/g.120193  ORF Transcript_52688/g.120193 Transcript_52688/m.120193 type:complete len:319 (+) Transcript_52688:303-1259(+)
MAAARAAGHDASESSNLDSLWGVLTSARRSLVGADEQPSLWPAAVKASQSSASPWSEDLAEEGDTRVDSPQQRRAVRAAFPGACCDVPAPWWTAGQAAAVMPSDQAQEQVVVLAFGSCHMEAVLQICRAVAHERVALVAAFAGGDVGSVEGVVKAVENRRSSLLVVNSALGDEHEVLDAVMSSFRRVDAIVLVNCSSSSVRPLLQQDLEVVKSDAFGSWEFGFGVYRQIVPLLTSGPRPMFVVASVIPVESPCGLIAAAVLQELAQRVRSEQGAVRTSCVAVRSELQMSDTVCDQLGAGIAAALSGGNFTCDICFGAW